MEIKDNSARARIIINLLSINLGLEMVLAFLLMIVYYEAVNGLDDIKDMMDIVKNVGRLLFAFIYVVSSIVCCIFFISWFRRAYYNVHQINKGLSYSEGWAAGAWFTPFVNLFYPYTIMEEIWYETQRGTIGKTEVIHTNKIGWWWGLWIVAGIMDRFSTKQWIGKNSDKIQENMLLLDISTIGVLIICNYLLIELIISISEMEKEMRISRAVDNGDMPVNINFRN